MHGIRISTGSFSFCVLGMKVTSSAFLVNWEFNKALREWHIEGFQVTIISSHFGLNWEVHTIHFWDQGVKFSSSQFCSCTGCASMPEMERFVNVLQSSQWLMCRFLAHGSTRAEKITPFRLKVFRSQLCPWTKDYTSYWVTRGVTGQFVRLHVTIHAASWELNKYQRVSAVVSKFFTMLSISWALNCVFLGQSLWQICARFSSQFWLSG